MTFQAMKTGGEHGYDNYLLSMTILCKGASYDWLATTWAMGLLGMTLLKWLSGYEHWLRPLAMTIKNQLLDPMAVTHSIGPIGWVFAACGEGDSSENLGLILFLSVVNLA